MKKQSSMDAAAPHTGSGLDWPRPDPGPRNCAEHGLTEHHPTSRTAVHGRVSTADDLEQLRRFRLNNGLFLAAPENYDKVWIRDNVYIGLGYEAAGMCSTVRGMYHGLLDILHRYAWKIDWAVWSPPAFEYEYIHPRYTMEGNEIPDPWGFKQHDAVGIFLYRVAVLEKSGISVLRDFQDRHLVQKLVWYLDRIQYWRDPDSGMWEENVELHTSSIAACVRGLEELHGLVIIPDGLIDRGRQALKELLPGESHSKEVDMAQLSLVFPLGMNLPEIVDRVEEQLSRDRGVIRYHRDWYHHHPHGEAEWTMGAPWLGLCYLALGDRDRAKQCLEWTDSLYVRGELPECYIGNHACEHTPLAWSHAMALALRCALRA